MSTEGEGKKGRRDLAGDELEEGFRAAGVEEGNAHVVEDVRPPLHQPHVLILAVLVPGNWPSPRQLGLTLSFSYRPLEMGFLNWFVNSRLSPRNCGLAKLTISKTAENIGH